MARFLLLVSIMAATASAQQPTPPLAVQRTTPLVCAHRGWLSTHELENSVAVMHHSYAAGVRMVEFDLQESKDGTIYLMHDELLDRTTTASGPIAARTSEQLQTVSVRNPDTHAPVEPISTFNELLDWASQNDLALMVDLKGAPPADAVEAIKNHRLLNRVVLLTFDTPTADKAFAADPTVLVSVLARTPEEVDAAIVRAHGHPLALYLPQTGSPALFSYAHHTGHVVITDLMHAVDDQAALLGESVYRDYLSRRPADIVVTNHALMLLHETSNP
jgi:glycerophosphoryl diester phosphodiesterase